MVQSTARSHRRGLLVPDAGRHRAGLDDDHRDAEATELAQDVAEGFQRELRSGVGTIGRKGDQTPDRS